MAKSLLLGGRGLENKSRIFSSSIHLSANKLSIIAIKPKALLSTVSFSAGGAGSGRSEEEREKN